VKLTLAGSDLGHRQLQIGRDLLTSTTGQSVRGATAGQIEDGTGGKGALLAGEPADHRGNFLRFNKAIHGNLRAHGLDVFLAHLREQIGRCRSRRYAVNQNAARG